MEPKQKKFPVIPVVVIVAVVVLGLGIATFVILAQNFFLSGKKVVFLAAYKTLLEDPYGEELAKLSELKFPEATVDIKVDADGTDIDGRLVYSMNEGQISVDSTVSTGGADVSGKFYLDDTKLEAHLPFLYDKIFYYDYRADNTGYIKDFLKENLNIDITLLNRVIGSSVSMMKKYEKYTGLVTEDVQKYVEKYEFEKVEEKSFTVNGEERKCGGYGTVITVDDMVDIVNIIYDDAELVFGDDLKNMEEAAELASNVAAGASVLSDGRNAALAEVKKAGDMALNCYIFESRLAAVTSEYTGGSLEVLFEGGDKRTSNMSVIIKSGSESYEITKKGSFSEGTESAMVSMKGFGSGNTNFSYTCNPEKGEFSVEYGSDVIEGTYSIGEDSISVNARDASSDMSFSITSGARISELTGASVDLGNMSYLDMLELALSVSGLLMGGLG